MNHLTSSQLNELRQQLLRDKSELERHFALDSHYGLSDSLRVQTGELSTNDNHPADLGTELYERGKDIALNENAEHQLHEINEALERIEKGKYGTCAACGKEIPFDRLRAIPTTMYCVDHVPDPDMSERRPVEEQLLEPPFGRTSLDELPEQNQFDGEDAWQIVERWGTSDSPAMAEDPEVHDYDDLYVEADENEGYVEAYESFLATDIYGQQVTVVRNRKYQEYMDRNEGEALLEPDPYKDIDDGDGYRYT